MGWGQKVDNLDPQTSRGNRNWWVLAELYDTLTVLPDQSLQAAPQLAESWTMSPDGKEYVFKIRKGVKFSTGSELNAHAVKFALDRLQTIGLGPLYMTRDVYNRTDVIDDYTVKTVLNFPYPVWLAILSQPAGDGHRRIPRSIQREVRRARQGAEVRLALQQQRGRWRVHRRGVQAERPGRPGRRTRPTGRAGAASTSSGSSWRRCPRSRPGSCALEKGDLDVRGGRHDPARRPGAADQGPEAAASFVTKAGQEGAAAAQPLDAVDQPEQQDAAHERHQRAAGAGPLLQLRPLQSRR